MTEDEKRARKQGYARKYAATDPGKRREQSCERNRRWRAANPEADRAKGRKWYAKEPPMGNYFRKLRRRYGLTPEQYWAMFVAQNGVCAICRQSHKNGSRLHVDHNHTTGRVRALLCNGCNIIAGALENPKFEEVAAYLEKHRQP